MVRPPVFFDDQFLVKQWKTSLAPERLEYRAGRGWTPRTPVVGPTARAAARSRRALSALSALSIAALAGWALLRLSMSRQRRELARPGSLNLRIIRGRKAA